MMPSAAAPSTSAKAAQTAVAAAKPVAAAPGNLVDPLASHPSAHAYTQGADVAFGPGAAAADNAAGKQLLAHELSHVVQQRP